MPWGLEQHCSLWSLWCLWVPSSELGLSLHNHVKAIPSTLSLSLSAPTHTWTNTQPDFNIRPKNIRHMVSIPWNLSKLAQFSLAMQHCHSFLDTSGSKYLPISFCFSKAWKPSDLKFLKRSQINYTSKPSFLISSKHAWNLMLKYNIPYPPNVKITLIFWSNKLGYDFRYLLSLLCMIHNR